MSKLLSVCQLARALNMSSYTLRSAVKRGLPCKRDQRAKGDKLLFDLEECKEWLENNRTNKQQETTQDNTMKATTPAQKKSAPIAPKPAPVKEYDPARIFREGDEVKITLCNGRGNGIPTELMFAVGVCRKNEDAVGMVAVEACGRVEQIPACNLMLIRAVEDIPVYAIKAEGNGFYVTSKGVKEACGAFWYGGLTGKTKDEAESAAELYLEMIQEK